MSEPKRIQLRRTKGWRKPERAIVVARPSKWGNWYRVTKVNGVWCVGFESDPCISGWSDRADAIAVAVRWFRQDLETAETYHPGVLAHDLADLRGHDLACWCPLDQPCHADVLLELANQS